MKFKTIDEFDEVSTNWMNRARKLAEVAKREGNPHQKGRAIVLMITMQGRVIRLQEAYNKATAMQKMKFKVGGVVSSISEYIVPRPNN